MLKRIGILAWWAGALFFVLGLYGATQSTTPMIPMFVGTAFTGICFSISFVLGGTFWRPPTVEPPRR
jgi:hypothetical protein